MIVLGSLAVRRASAGLVLAGRLAQRRHSFMYLCASALTAVRID